MGGAASASGSFKENGDNSFRNHDYLEAIYWYTLGIRDTSNNSKDVAILFSNRSAAYNSINLPDKALYDAECCINLRSEWFKGYYRAAVASEGCGQLDEAIEYATKGLVCMPSEKALLKYHEKLLKCRKSMIDTNTTECNNNNNSNNNKTGAGNSSIYSWGEGRDNQLGFIQTSTASTSTSTTVEYPMPLHSLDLKHIVDTACGAMHSVCIASTGEIYSWGNNTYGQCGIPIPIATTTAAATTTTSTASVSASNLIQIPRIIPKLLGKHVVGVACGAGHTVCIDDQGLAYAWGIGR